MPEVDFTIDPATGQLELHIKGIRGSACQDVAKIVEKFLGTPRVDQNTPEYDVKPQVRPQVRFKGNRGASLPGSSIRRTEIFSSRGSPTTKR